MQAVSERQRSSCKLDKPHLHVCALTEPLWLSHVWLPLTLNGRVTSCTQSESRFHVSHQCHCHHLGALGCIASHRCSHRRRYRCRCTMPHCNFLSSGGTATLRLWMSGHFINVLLTLYRVLHGKFLQTDPERCGTTHGDPDGRLRVSALARTLGEGCAKGGKLGVSSIRGHANSALSIPQFP
jgi:hypothetical protein